MGPGQKRTALAGPAPRLLPASPPDPGFLRGRNPETSWGHFQFTELARRFLEGIAQNRPPTPSLEDGLAAQRIIEAAVESSRQNAWVSV